MKDVKNCSSTVGIDYTKLHTCATGKQGVRLLAASAAASTAANVTAAPTIIVGGQETVGGQTTVGIAQSLCKAIACQELSTTIHGKKSRQYASSTALFSAPQQTAY